MSHMEQSKTWKGALLASTSLLAFGVPMAAESWQIKGIRYLDMWKGSYDLETIEPVNDKDGYYTYTGVSFNAKKL